MMKVKTFNAGLAHGWSSTFAYLDKKIAELGDVEIVEIQDTFYATPAGVSFADEPRDPCIARRITYRDMES
ncbi:MAG: hypothetical protein HY454_00490 [Parcubacteria group bacterium]|nr:hypothetical protein [Parcubacteria group bacterium]